MQPPHPDQQIQYTSPQYQPIMLCPVQYVYEHLLPDEQGQPSPAYQTQAYLLNVQNTPPWAQNRPNMIYMQQMSNIQPYMQQVIQNPIYNYQYQPMIVQEHIRPSYMNQSMINPQIQQQMMNQNQIMQVPNQMVQNVTQNQVIQNVAQNQVIQNVAQNQLMQNQVNQNQINPNIIQNQIRFQMEKRETPILASMLNVRKQLHQNEIVSIMRPQYQNVRPQMIIVNPIAKHTCVHNTQKESPVLIDKQQRDIQNIRSQVPEGLSVKTIQVPVTALVKPNDNIFQNIAQVDDIPVHTRVNNKPKPLNNRDTQTNYKRKIKELLELNNRDGNEVLAKRMCLANKPDEQIYKAQVLIDTPPNTTEMQTNNTVNTQIINVKSQGEEKKLRNTVFVQARGRVNDVRVNDIHNVNYTNISNAGTSNANIMFNTKSIENFNKSVVLNNENLDLNMTNNELFNIVVVNNNNVMHNNVNLNNQSAERIGSEININNIGNLEVPIQIQMQTENNETEVNFDDQFISEQVVQNMKVTTNEKIPSLEVVVKENERQDTVKLTQTITSNNGETTMAENTGQNEDLTQIITTENNSTIKKLLANEPKTRKSKNTKVTDTEMTPYKLITNVPQTANNEALNDSNNLQSKSTMTLIPKLPTNLGEDSMNKFTDMSMTKIEILSDTNQNKSDVKDVTNVKITDGKEIRKKKELKNKTKLAKNEVDKKSDYKSKETKIDKPKKDKKKMVDTKVLIKEPVAMYVLTHVLDGHIIQESNVPFMVQKPSLLPLKEKPVVREERVDINEMTEEIIEESPVETKDNTVKDISVETENTVKDSIVETENTVEDSIDETENTVEDSIVETKDNIEDSIRVETEASSNTDTEKDKEERNKEFDKPDTSVADEDNPFKGLRKDILEAWTISDVTSYLMKYEHWRDTALILADQEIDGESLLLASKDQLLQIDICEEQAQEISEFLEQVQ